MRVGSLSLHQLPPLSLPMGYFLTAPLFGLAAGVFFALSGELPWLSRWMPDALAGTHLLVLGFMGMVMMGALVQLIPVISAAEVPWACRLAPWIRLTLGVGVAALACGLSLEIAALFSTAIVALTLAFGMFLVPLCLCLVRRIGGGDAIQTIRVAVLCLLVTVVIGVYLATDHLAHRGWTPLHLGFGLVGWLFLLIAAVSFQVIPMFHVAPNYPRWLTRGLPILSVAGILIQSRWLIGACFLAYSLTTLYLLRVRKRRAPDVTLRFWQLAMVVLSLGVLAWAMAPASEQLLGALYLIGFVLTVMLGMLHKIVAFLVFMHLQRTCLATGSSVADLPTMHQIVPLSQSRWQLFIHSATIVLCVSAAYFPSLGPFAGVALAADFVWLLSSLVIAHQCFRRTLPRLVVQRAQIPKSVPSRRAGHTC